MISLSSILVDIDSIAADHPAVEQAVDLAARCGAGIKIVDVLPCVPTRARHFVTDRLEQELVDHRCARLDTVARRVQEVSVGTELLRGRPGNALIQEVRRSGHDLLVRSHERDFSESPRRYGAVDMELLRQCPCPVWLIGRSHRHPSRLLAAIHADPSNALEQGLNTTILEWALLLKELGDAELTVLQAWTAFGASLLESRMSPDEFAAYIDAARRGAEEALRTFTEPFMHRLRGVVVHAMEGEPQDVITHVVESQHIDVVVMGTVARTGIAGLVMGNTAERVLQRLHGSVLAVKPPGFRSPVVQMSSSR
jgi:nucleotide-binding universal stress UspA family protein